MESESWRYLGTAVASFVLGIWGVYQTHAANRARKEAIQAKAEAGQNRTAVAIKDVHAARIAELESQLDREQKRSEKESREWATRYEKNQEFHHGQANRAQGLLATCQDECANLKATRDFSPILTYIKAQDAERKALQDDRREQIKINGELFRAIRDLHSGVAKLNDKLGIAGIEEKSLQGI